MSYLSTAKQRVHISGEIEPTTPHPAARRRKRNESTEQPGASDFLNVVSNADRAPEARGVSSFKSTHMSSCRDLARKSHETTCATITPLRGCKLPLDGSESRSAIPGAKPAPNSRHEHDTVLSSPDQALPHGYPHHKGPPPSVAQESAIRIKSHAARYGVPYVGLNA